jgi:recombination protein RecT
MNTENKNLPTVKEKNIIDDVLSKVVQFRESGELVLPKDYSAENALKSAYLILSEAVDKQKNPVLTVCTKASIANSLLDMVVQGLSPMKNQCYFIPYGDKLQLSRSYLGSIAVARRVGLKSIVANVVFQDDIFSYQIDSKTGLYSIIDHTQELQNIDISKIRGAYAITTLEDGTRNVTVMTIAQIKTSWLQGYAKGNSGAHTSFTDEMCKKTVINRACKIIINSSTDSILTINDNDDDIEDIAPVEPKKANRNEIEIAIEKPIDVNFSEEKKNGTPIQKADF